MRGGYQSVTLRKLVLYTLPSESSLDCRQDQLNYTHVFVHSQFTTQPTTRNCQEDTPVRVNLKEISKLYFTPKYKENCLFVYFNSMLATTAI